MQIIFPHRRKWKKSGENPQYLTNFYKDTLGLGYIPLPVDIESFWTEGYAGQTLNSGHKLAIFVL